jgi:dethiobiotin synthetase
MKNFFVTGIGTDVGKTVVSAIIAEALEALYWKPVQAGDLAFSDSHKVEKYCSENVEIYPEKYRLKTPASPHYAAQLDGVSISLDDFILPKTDKNLLIEGAGGILVPLNDSGLLYIDLIKHLNLPVIVVSRNYLGSINHTLMTFILLKHYEIPVEILVFNGDENKATEEVILQHFPIEKVIRIPIATELNSQFIQEQAKQVREILI